MSSSASNTAPTTNNNNNNNNSAGFTPSGDVIQILNNEYKSILSDLNLKKFPKIKEVKQIKLYRVKFHILFFVIIYIYYKFYCILYIHIHFYIDNR